MSGKIGLYYFHYLFEWYIASRWPRMLASLCISLQDWYLSMILIWLIAWWRDFFITAESLYGPKFLTLNAHILLHLQKCYKDYGPCYGFWLFSFELYNGMLGKFHTMYLLNCSWCKNLMKTWLLQACREILESEHGYVFTKFLSSKISGTSSETKFKIAHWLVMIMKTQ